MGSSLNCVNSLIFFVTFLGHIQVVMLPLWFNHCLLILCLLNHSNSTKMSSRFSRCALLMTLRMSLQDNNRYYDNNIKLSKLCALNALQVADVSESCTFDVVLLELIIDTTSCDHWRHICVLCACHGSIFRFIQLFGSFSYNQSCHFLGFTRQ
jgi:hypothetical protein